MRSVSLGHPSRRDDDKVFREWVLSCMAEIERASYDDPNLIAKDYTVSNYTKTRTLDASTATTADIANVLCTLIYDMQNRGTKRSQ